MVNFKTPQKYVYDLAFTSIFICASWVCASSGPAFAQSSVGESDGDRVKTYASLLQEIANMQTNLDHQNLYLRTQEQRIANLQQQIKQVAQTSKAIEPMIDKMVASIDNEISADIPFNAEERFDRLGSLRELVEDKEASISTKIRRAFNIYDIEVGYGQTLEAYDGDHPDAARVGERRQACLSDANSRECGLTKNLRERLDDGETIEDLVFEEDLSNTSIFDGTYLRYGRLALAYMQADGSEVLRYNRETKSWETMSGNKALEVRRGIRIARGESAPNVLTVPVLVSN